MRILAFAFLALFLVVPSRVYSSDRSDTIARVKRSVIPIGTFEPGRSPAFSFRGTAFVVGDGSVIATNAHVLPDALSASGRETLAVLLPDGSDERTQAREVRRIAVDEVTDLALLRLKGPALNPLELDDADRTREGDDVLMTGYPIGAVLGPFPATHRAMIAAISPIAIPQRRAAELTSSLVHRIANGTFPVFQLDATAYPGNSGSPVYVPSSGRVVGIVNMVLIKGTKESALSQPSGITYAIPISHLRALLKTVS